MIYLFNYSNRKLNQDIINDFNGQYSKFAIRIVGKSFKINNEGERVYKNNLKKIDDSVETLYLLGAKSNRDFIKSIGKQCKTMIGFDILYEKEYSSVIKDKDGNDFEVDTFLLVLRNEKIKTVHRK